MIKEILIYPKDKEMLTTKSVDVENVEDVKDLIQDLKDTLNNTETGVGISAIQLGVPKKVCIIKLDDNRTIAMINPKITKKEGICLYREGCLSAPNVERTIQRARRVSVEYIDEDGNKVRTTKGGLPAIIIQHEYEHFERNLSGL